MVFFYLRDNYQSKELEARQLTLQYRHNKAINQFSSSVGKFAGLVSGMQSYMNLSAETPSAEDFQKFVRNQFNYLGLKDSIVVSFVDTSHVFVQSFTLNTIDPANLVGVSVKKLRNEESIKKLDRLMLYDSLKMFSPINLKEGWVGLPINFRVHRDGNTLGYIAPILNLKSILDDIYKDDIDKEFVYRFSTEDDFDFDRASAYNGTEIYNKNQDSEYYKNFEIDSTQFLYSTNNYYGYDITIGTAFKNEYVGNKEFDALLIFWYTTIAVLAIVVIWQVNRYRKLNSQLTQNNNLLLSNRKEINDKNLLLQQLNDTQNRFFSIIGHDIKQPLSAIEGLLSLLQDEDISDPDLADIIKNLTKSTKNTTNLLNNLLRWARSQTGDIKFTPVPLELNSMWKDVVELSFYQAKEKNIRIIYESEGELKYVGDRDMIETIFRNLLTNAIKFTNFGGLVEILTRREKDSIVIKVKDTGIGMTQDVLDSLFEIDQPTNTVGTSGEMGTGLGLVLCKTFAKQHNGRIEVKSEPNVGTEFTLILPETT